MEPREALVDSRGCLWMSSGLLSLGLPGVEGDWPLPDPEFGSSRIGFGEPTPLLCVGQLTSEKEIEQVPFPRALCAV